MGAIAAKICINASVATSASGVLAINVYIRTGSVDCPGGEIKTVVPNSPNVKMKTVTHAAMTLPRT
jgi:hypothetical protein